MKKRIIIGFITSLVCLRVFGNETSFDNQFFTVMNAAVAMPDLQSWMALNSEQKKTNAEALYLLHIKASQTAGLSNIVQLTVLASADEAFDRYISSITRTRADLENFIQTNPRDIPAALQLMDDSLKILACLPEPYFTLNVSPPDWMTDAIPVISGMDPKGIKDLKARAEYERRIAENNQAIGESNARIRIKNEIISLKFALKAFAQNLQSENFNAKIKASPLPDEMKLEIIGKQEHKN